MKIFTIISGLLLLILGRKLFWLFIAIIGFLAGLAFSSIFFAAQPPWVMLLIAIGFGLLGALLAVFAQRIAFALAGFYAGSYIALNTARTFGVNGKSAVLFIVGGIIGSVLAALLIDWALILLSCMVGAWVIVEALGFEQTVSSIVFVILVIVGIISQTSVVNRSAKR